VKQGSRLQTAIKPIKQKQQQTNKQANTQTVQTNKQASK
jgi:hypothetical protein